jgi:hypothetical protein
MRGTMIPKNVTPVLLRIVFSCSGVRMNVNKLVFLDEVAHLGTVFLLARTACRLSRIHWAISTSATWGELAIKVDAEILKEILENGERQSFENFCSDWLFPHYLGRLMFRLTGTGAASRGTEIYQPPNATHCLMKLARPRIT